MRVLILTVLTIIFSFIILSIPSQGNPDYNTPQCNYCHNKLSVDVYENERDECGNCHNMQPATHNPLTCDNCHGVDNQVAYHTTHANVTCQTCHGINGEGKPSQPINDCAGCHSSQVHDIHTQCIDCHEPSIKSRTAPTTESLRPKKDYSKYTLYFMLKTLYKIINGGIT